MEEKNLSTLLPETLNALTEQQKEQLAACRTVEELIALLGEFGIELPDALLNDAAGGGVSAYGEWTLPSEADKKAFAKELELFKKGESIIF